MLREEKEGEWKVSTKKLWEAKKMFSVQFEEKKNAFFPISEALKNLKADKTGEKRIEEKNHRIRIVNRACLSTRDENKKERESSNAENKI